MNTTDFKRFLSNPEESIDSAREYLIENHSKITRKYYEGQQYDRLTVLYLVFSHVAKSDSDLNVFIEEQTSDIKGASSIRERVFCLLTNTRNMPCENGRMKKFKEKGIEPVYLFCDNQGRCACQNKSFEQKVAARSKEERASIVQKRKATNKERFGAEFALQNSEIKQRVQQTNLRKYGATSPLGAEAIRDKLKTTNKERYGVEYAIGNPEIRRKRAQTNLERYGNENAILNPKIQEKKKSTNLERYGSISPLGSAKIQEKAAATVMERYGAVNGMLNPEVRQKLAETNLKTYGSVSPFGNSAVQQKTIETNIERYGFGNPLLNPDIKTKKDQTMMERFGSASPFENKDIVSKAAQTNLERHGGNPFANAVIQEKIKETNLERYGTEYPAQSPVVHQRNIEKYGFPSPSMRHYTQDAYEFLNNKEQFESEFKKLSVSSIIRKYGVSGTTLYRYCKIHGIELEGQSSYETEIKTFLDDYNIISERNTRKIIPPQELDFYIPAHNLAIEFNGIYWHSTARIEDKNYHFKKWSACQGAGVRLLMINEDEWLNNSAAIKLKILNVCGIGERGEGARKHSVRKISNREGMKFAEDYHIQGSPSTVSLAYGSFIEEKLTGVILFNNQRGTGDLELIRFCSDGKSYSGLFSKIFQTFVKENPEIVEVLSFADLRYSEGNLYEQAGFDKVAQIKPDYRYVVEDKTFHKSTFMKSKIQKRFGIDMTNLTERQAMDILEIPRLYDCGKIKYVWKRR